MKANKKNMSANELALKAMGKQRREMDIALHGKQTFFAMSKTEKNPKAYTRKDKHKGMRFAE